MLRQGGQVILRPATPADRWAVRQLFGALHTYNTSLDARFALAEGWEVLLDQHVDQIAETGRGLVVLAWDGDRPIGLLIMADFEDSPLFHYRRWAELQVLFVEPDVRGSSAAQHLVEAGAAWSKQRGYDRIQLFVTAANERAKRFYARVGFYPVQEIWRLDLGE